MDDQPELRRLVYHALKHRYRVLEAGDADAAIALMEKDPADLVLLDLYLPPCLDSPDEGLRAQRQIHRLSRSVPVVIVSSHDAPGLRDALIAGGAREFLSKPIRAAELEKLVEGLLEEQR